MPFTVIEGGKGKIHDLPPLNINNVEVVRNWTITERFLAAYQEGNKVHVFLNDIDTRKVRHDIVPVPRGTEFTHWDHCHSPEEHQMTHYRLIFRKKRALAERGLFG